MKQKQQLLQKRQRGLIKSVCRDCTHVSVVVDNNNQLCVVIMNGGLRISNIIAARYRGTKNTCSL